jgi:hypothetical protein
MGETAMSVLEKLKKLEAEAKDLRAQAKREALGAVKGALAALNSLGYSYGLIEHDAKPKDGPFPMKGVKKKAGKTGIKRQRDPNKPCDICGFVTDPGHDARKHRGQGGNKKPFTAKELDELGLKKK